MAFFSGDAWPDRAAPFMRVSLDATNLRWLHSMSAGVDNPVFGMFLQRGVRVTTSSGASAEPIAGTVMMYLLALSRDLPQLTRAQAAHEWQPNPYRELAGRSIAVIGYGPIGEHVVRMAKAFGMHPVIVRRAARGDEPAPVRTLAEVDDVVASVDVVVVALPLADETRGLISRDVIARMRPDALFVNVGRGELVDQACAHRRVAGGPARRGGPRRLRPGTAPGRRSAVGSSERHHHATQFRHDRRQPRASGPDLPGEPRSLRARGGSPQRGGRERSADMIPFVGISG